MCRASILFCFRKFGLDWAPLNAQAGREYEIEVEGLRSRSCSIVRPTMESPCVRVDYTSRKIDLTRNTPNKEKLKYLY